MAWVGMVMSDMGAMHTKPLMSALIMAASQLVTWHDFLYKCSEKLAGQAFVANHSVLDYVSLQEPRPELTTDDRYHFVDPNLLLSGPPSFRLLFGISRR